MHTHMCTQIPYSTSLPVLHQQVETALHPGRNIKQESALPTKLLSYHPTTLKVGLSCVVGRVTSVKPPCTQHTCTCMHSQLQSNWSLDDPATHRRKLLAAPDASHVAEQCMAWPGHSTCMHPHTWSTDTSTKTLPGFMRSNMARVMSVLVLQGCKGRGRVAVQHMSHITGASTHIAYNNTHRVLLNLT